MKLSKTNVCGTTKVPKTCTVLHTFRLLFTVLCMCSVGLNNKLLNCLHCKQFSSAVGQIILFLKHIFILQQTCYDNSTRPLDLNEKQGKGILLSYFVTL